MKMVYNQEQEQACASTIQDNYTDDTVKEMAETTAQYSQKEPSLPPSFTDSGNYDNVDTAESLSPPAKQVATSPPLQEEFGKSFASRKIQVASLAIRSSHSASQSPLFAKHDMYRLYQQPFVASSLSPPTLISTNTRSFSAMSPPAGETSSVSRPSLPSHLLSPSTLLDTNDRALFDKTWSVLAPKSESNQQQQQQKKARRRVTFNEHIQFFDPPPPMDYYDHPPAQVTTQGNNVSPPASYQDDARHRDEEKGDLVKDSGNSMAPPPPPLPQYSSYWADHYTNSTENPSPLSEPPKQLHQSSVSSTTSSSSSSSTSSSSSSLSLSLSSSSTQTNSINNNSANIGTINRSPPFFNRRFNASTSSLPAYHPISSSNVYGVIPASGSASSLVSSSPLPTDNPGQIALQRKGNKISSHAILEILESRSAHGAGNSKQLHHRRTTKSNKSLSSLSPRPAQDSVRFDQTLDSVKQDIRQAIERAKASNTDDQQLPMSPPTSLATTTATTEILTNEMPFVEPTGNNATLNLEDSNGNSQLSSEDDSSDSSATIPGGESDTKDGPMELLGGGNVSDDKSSLQDRDCDKVAFFESNPRDHDASVANPTEDGDDQAPTTDGTVTTEGVLIYLPSSDNQLSDFGDTLLNEFDRITGDSTHLIFSNADQPTRTEHHRVVPIEESCNSDRVEIHDGGNTGNNILDISTEPSAPWRILGSRNDSPSLNGNDKQLEKYPSTPSTANGRLYIKVIAAENLDFPINQGAPSIQCSVNDGSHYLGSGHYKMQHNIHFNHEFILNDMAPDGEFTLTLHAVRPGEQNATTAFTKRWSKRSSFTSKNDDLARYISQQDGALAQTRVSLKSVSYQCRTKLCTASFALVNGWYQPAKKSASHHPLFLSKAQRGKQNGPVQEKAVGKITLELFYLPNADEQIPDLPADMDSCEDALNVQRFHQTVWRYGYMSQLGGDVKFWRRRYFKLIGGHLYSNADTAHSPRTMIDLSKAVAIASDNRVIMESKTHKAHAFDGHSLLMDLESQINVASPYKQNAVAISSASTVVDDTADDELSSYSVKNSFQVKFDNGDTIEFFCDSNYERERWLDVLKVILGRIPTLPTWLSV